MISMKYMITFFLFFLITQLGNSGVYADDLLRRCAPNVALDTMAAIIAVESSGNPYAIAVVRGAKQPKQPRNRAEALKIIRYLNSINANFTVGLAQINQANFNKFKVTAEDLLNPCLNLRISEKLLQDCYTRTHDIDKTLSCYYSGNPRQGFKKDFRKTSYVERVYAHSSSVKVPSLKPQSDIRTPFKLTNKEDPLNKKLTIENSIEKKNDYGEYAF